MIPNVNKPIHNLISNDKPLKATLELIEKHLKSILYQETITEVNSKGMQQEILRFSIDHKSDHVKSFYNHFPSLIEAIFTSRNGLINRLDSELVDFYTYDMFVQMLSPNILPNSLMEFILSSSANNSTYSSYYSFSENFQGHRENHVTESLGGSLYSLSDLSYLSNNLSLLKEMKRYDLLERYLHFGFPRRRKQEIVNRNLLTKVPSLSNSLTKSIDFGKGLIRNSLTALKNVFDDNSKAKFDSISKQEEINDVLINPFELFVINLLYYIKKTYTNIKVRSLHSDNHNFNFNQNPNPTPYVPNQKDNKSIFTTDNEYSVHSIINKNSIDHGKTLVSNFLLRVFQNLIEYLSSETSIDEYVNSNYNNGSMVDFNSFKIINDKLKNERLVFVCKMIDLIWCSDYYMAEVNSIDNLITCTDLSSSNLLVINCIQSLLSNFQCFNLFRVTTNTVINTNNNSLLGNNDNPIQAEIIYNENNYLCSYLASPLFYFLKSAFDFFLVNPNIVNKSSISLLDVVKLYKTFILPWKTFTDYHKIYYIHLEVRSFIFTNLQYYTYLFNKLICTLSKVSSIEKELMYELKDILNPYEIDKDKIFFNSVNLQVFYEISIFRPKNSKLITFQTQSVRSYLFTN